MSTDATQFAPAEQYDTYEQYAPESPFEQRYDFAAESPAATEADVWETAALESPFISQYGDGSTEASYEEASFRELLFDLYDTEMDRFLGELVQEAAAAAAEQANAMGETASESVTEQFLDNWIEPVREHAERMLDGISESLAQVDAASLTESQLDEVFQQFEPEGTGLEQYFEGFLKSLWNKAKKIASGAIDLAKKGAFKVISMIPGLSGLINRLKALVAPLLKRVLKMAMDQLPPRLRPIAVQLARKIVPGFQGEEEESLEGQAAVPDVATLQRELDETVASLLFARDENEQEAVLAEQLYQGERADEGVPISAYQEAREQFVDSLERGQDPREALEQFLPVLAALMPVAKTVIGIIGRPRVVGFLAGYLAKLIERYIGADASKQLSQAVVDAGLRMIGLEVAGESDLRQLAPNVIAGTVEDTMRRVAQLDETTLENPHLLEAAVNEAFHEAAAENFPSSELIPDLHEAAQVRGVWVSLPLRGRRKYYKKYTQVFDVELTPQLAGSVRTFGGKTLASYLKDKLGITGPVRARVHLYQALPGGWPSRIARFERIGGGGRGSWMQLHPLTPEAAAALLQHPRLGRAVPGRYLTSRMRPAVGQRFYYLQIEGARPAQVRRSSEVNLTLDFPGDEVRAFVYLSEADAQDIAAKVRRRELTAVITLAKRVYAAGVETALGGDLQRHVKIRHEALDQEEFLGGALKRLAQVVLDHLKARVVEWLGKAVGDYFQSRGAEFIAAAEDPADGVTIVVTIKSPPGFPFVRKLLKGEFVSPVELANPAALFKGSPTYAVKTVPGFRFD
jgi:hypothetical protein